MLSKLQVTDDTPWFARRKFLEVRSEEGENWNE